MLKSNKAIGLILMIFILLIVIPASFADENVTELAIDNVNDSPVGVSQESVLKEGVDIYFNASAESDGNGSIDAPFKYLIADKIKSNSNIYLADGEYVLDRPITIQQVNFIGNGANTTILKYNGVAFTVSNYLTLTNLTILGANIQNKAKLDATNVVFAQCKGSDRYSYDNHYGGAIYCPSGTLSIKNCTFIDNHAEYGGAIYIGGGSLDIIDSMFINNYAYNFGGSIACEKTGKVSISRSKFFNSSSLLDAGGAIYLKSSSSLTINDVEIANSSATFGGAIVSLYTSVSLSYLKVYNSYAEWDGGAVYHLFGNFSSTYGNFYNNSAKNGGALFIDNSTNLILRSNSFKNNSAVLCAGAIYSLCNTLKSASSVRQFNTFEDNVAAFSNDEYEQAFMDFIISSGNYTMYRQNQTVIGELPSSYDSRNYNLVTPAKDQQSGGNCWAFAVLATLESAILKASGQSLDLSEENMKNVISKYSDYGWKMETNDGGYDNMPLGYLLSWLGPVLESDDVYDDKSALSPVLESIMHVQNVAFLKRDSYLDNDDIKMAIMKYGAVSSPILMDGSYYNGNGYYCWVSDYANHLVSIIGWDDSYSRTNFYGLSSSKGDGAWIVKNSWGPKWDGDGCFYVSYYDEVFAQPNRGNPVFAFILNDTIKYDKNYQYDIGGMTDYYYNGSSQLWYKNVFKAESDEFIAAVSTYFEKKTNWTASVFVNGNLQATCHGTSNPGYYTFDLEKLIPVAAGDEFEVQFNVSGLNVASIPISESYSLNKEIYKPGISFISDDGENWQDFYYVTGKYLTHTYYSQVACIKAFTIENIINTTLDLIVYNNSDIEAKVLDQYGNLLKNGNVTFNVNGLIYTVNVSNGIALLKNTFLNQIHNVIAATFNQIGYNSSSDAVAVDMPRTSIDLLMNISKFSNNATIYLEGSNNVSTVLIVKINDEDYPVLLSNGSAYIYLTGLANGLYVVEVICNDLMAYQFNNLSDSFVIDVKETRIITNSMVTFENSGALFNITLVDENGEILSGKEINVVLNNMTFTDTTDSSGNVLIPINLTYGDYSIDVSFNGDAIYLASRQSENIMVKMNVTVGIEVDRVLNNVIVNVILSKLINESLTVFVNDKSYAINSTNGMASLELFNLSNGIYNISVNLDEIDIFNSLPANSTVCVDVKNTEIKSYNLLINDVDDFTFNITLTDENGLILPNKNITFILNNITYNEVTDENGVAFIPLDLTSGMYEIFIAFAGDNDYFASSVVNAIKVRIKIDIDIWAYVYQNEALVNIDVSRPINDSMIVRFNNAQKMLPLTNGHALIVFTNLSNGDYNIAVILNDYYYEFTPVGLAFPIDVKKTRIISEDLITSEGKGLFNITLVDENDEVLVDKELTIVLDNQTFIRNTDSNGRVSIPVNLTYGDYSVDIDFKGDLNYYESGSSNNIKVKIDVGIEFDVNRSLNDVDVNVKLSKLINESLTVIVNDKSYTIYSTDGNATLKLFNLSNGDYNITVSLDDEDTYNSAAVNSTFIIDVKNTQIQSENLVISDADYVNFNVTLTDENGVALADKNVTFVIDDVVYNAVSNSNGVAFIPLNLAMGEYDIEVIFAGDNDYFASGVSNFIKVKSKVDLGVLVDVYQDSAVVNINISKSVNESLTVNVNGKSYNIVSIDGKAYLELSNLTNDVYDVNVALDDEDNYVFSTVNVTFAVDVKNTQIHSGDLVISDADSAVFNVTLTDENGVALANKNITFVLDDIVYNEVTDVDGVAFIPLDLAMGDYTITVSFEGDVDYFASGVSNFIKVKSKVDLDVLVDVYQDSAVVNINISKSVNESLTVNVNGKSYNIESTDGKAYLELSNLTNDVYDVSVSLDDVDNYVFSTVNVTFAIDVKASEIHSSDLIITDEDYANFNVTLTDENGVALANKNITFVLDGVIYNEVTDVNGVAFIPLDLAMGDYTITVSFEGDNDYFASDVSNSIKVKMKAAIDLSITKSLDSALININVSKGANGSLTVNVNDNQYILHSIDGKAHLELSNLTNGKYVVLVSLDKDSFDSQDVIYDFIINVKENNTAPSEVAVVDDDKNQFNITVADENNVVLPNSEVSIVLDDVRYDIVTDENGQVSIPLDLGLGEHQIDIYIKESDNQFKAIKSDTIAIKSKVDMDCDIDDSSDKVVVNVNLSKQINGTLEIVVDDDIYKFPISNKTMSLVLPDLDADVHDVEIRIAEGDKYEFDKTSAQVNVTVKKTEIFADDVVTYHQSGFVFTVTLVDEYGNPLLNKDIQFRFPNKTFLSKTNELGQSSINVDLSNGDYDVIVSFSGDNNYYGSSNVSKFSVKSTIITYDSLTKTYNSQYSFKLLDTNGNPLKNTQVVFSLDDVNYTKVSDINGIVSVPITNPAGMHDLIIYNPVSNESLLETINVVQRITNNKNLVMYEFAGNSYKVLVLDDNGKPESAGKVITFKVAGKTYTTKTDKNGYASIKIGFSARETTVYVTYKGFKVSNKIKVKPLLIAKNLSKKKAKSYKFQVKLVNKYGKAVKGKKLTFKIKGKKYTAKTNKKGIATLTIKLSLKVGTYKIYTSYGKSKITNTLKIKK